MKPFRRTKGRVGELRIEHSTARTPCFGPSFAWFFFVRLRKGRRKREAVGEASHQRRQSYRYLYGSGGLKTHKQHSNTCLVARCPILRRRTGIGRAGQATKAMEDWEDHSRTTKMRRNIGRESRVAVFDTAAYSGSSHR